MREGGARRVRQQVVTLGGGGANVSSNSAVVKRRNGNSGPLTSVERESLRRRGYTPKDIRFVNFLREIEMLIERTEGRPLIPKRTTACFTSTDITI